MRAQEREAKQLSATQRFPVNNKKPTADLTPFPFDPFSICFASAETPLQVLEMNPRDRYQVDTKTIMDLAEYFPGGGTDFQRPLTRRLTV